MFWEMQATRNRRCKLLGLPGTFLIISPYKAAIKHYLAEKEKIPDILGNVGYSEQKMQAIQNGK